MFTHKVSNWFVILMIAMVGFVSACGADTATQEEAAPLSDEAAQEEAAPAEEEVAEAAEEAPVEEVDVVAVVNAAMSSIPEGYLAVRMDGFKEAMENGAYVVDVREISEYEEGHIPGAVNIPIRTLAQSLEQIPADQPVMVYCGSGHRAAMALTALNTLGYNNVKSYAPSWRDWNGAGEEVSMEATEAGSFDVPEIDEAVFAEVDGFLSTIPEGWLAMGDMERLEQAIDNGAVLIDVREVSEFEEGHIPDAINIPIREIAQNLEQVPQDQQVFVYCASGHRAAMGLTALQTLGYTNVQSYPPGFPAWAEAGQPVEQ